MAKKRNIIQISIVVPAFNVEAYIVDTLRTIIPQLGHSTQLIVIDDGSTDSTRVLIEHELEGVESAVLVSQKNAGVSSARNRAVAMSEGEYIMFVDADDLLVHDAIKLIIERISTSSPDIICGGAFSFVAKGGKKELMNTGPSTQEMSLIENLSGWDAYAKIIKTGIFNPGIWANVYKKSLFIDYDIFFNEHLINNEDIDCVMDLFYHAKKFEILPSPYYCYRRYRNLSASNSYSIKRIESSLSFVQRWDYISNRMSRSEALKLPLTDYVAYQYSILLASLFISKDHRTDALISDVKLLGHLLLVGDSKKTRLVKVCYSMFGFKFTGRILALFLKAKGIAHV